jgi:hypothetical protein
MLDNRRRKQSTPYQLSELISSGEAGGYQFRIKNDYLGAYRNVAD